MRAAVGIGKYWLAANLMGAGLYLWLASKTWLEPELRGEPDVARGGDAVVWAVSALPVLLIAFVADLVWLSLGMASGLKGRGWGGFGLALCVGFGWAVIVAIDFANH